MSIRDPESNERFGGDTRITPAMEDYLKAIYRIEEDGHAVSNQRLAEEMELSGASVSNMIKRLNDLKLLVHNPYRGVTLTQAGNAVALEVIRHHRLLELYLTQALGFDIDQVHQEADRLEHHVSEELEARMERALGYPEFDPHGHPIPTRSGNLPDIADIPLTALPVGTSALVSRVSDRDPGHLRQIDSLGIRPGVRLSAASRETGSVHLTVTGNEVVLPEEFAELIHVVPEAAPATS